MYGENDRVFVSENLNDMWKWIDGPLTIQTLPGVGHAPHTEAPEIVTPFMMRWLEAIH